MEEFMKRILCIGGIVVLGAFSGGVALTALAPSIGGFIGATLFGWSGAAATSSGLAFLGGGSLATCGAGMAGGTAVLTTTGVVTGACVAGKLATTVAEEG